MSDKPISKGDLVMVIRWPCCGANLGKIFSVAEFAGGLKCGCGAPRVDGPIAMVREQVAAPVAWLKRLDPDALKDDVPTGEELTV